MPERAIWIESASVPVLRPLAAIVYSIPSASAVSTSSSKTLGERVEPRPITGPEPSGCEPSLLLVDAGRVGRVGDVDGDRDVGFQLEGRGAGAEQADLLLHRGDARHRAARAGALGAAAGRFERDVGAEPVVHRLGDEARAGTCIGSVRITIGSPTRTRASASSRSATPMSMCIDLSSTTFLRWSGSSRWIGLRPATPGTSAVAARSPRPAGRPGSAGPSRRSARTRGSPSRRCG